jgi:hypothetical protein
VSREQNPPPVASGRQKTEMIQFAFNDEESTFGGEMRIKDRFRHKVAKEHPQIS